MIRKVWQFIYIQDKEVQYHLSLVMNDELFREEHLFSLSSSICCLINSVIMKYDQNNLFIFIWCLSLKVWIIVKISFGQSKYINWTTPCFKNALIKWSGVTKVSKGRKKFRLFINIIRWMCYLSKSQRKARFCKKSLERLHNNNRKILQISEKGNHKVTMYKPHFRSHLCTIWGCKRNSQRRGNCCYCERALSCSDDNWRMIRMGRNLVWRADSLLCLCKSYRNIDR